VKKVIVLLAEGFEEVEALTPVDYLRRAGIEVCTVAIGNELTVRGARNIPIITDAILNEWRTTEKITEWDAVILPGGMPGSANLAASGDVRDLLAEMAAAEKWICAICAAPALVLAPIGLLRGKKFTCYPGREESVHDGQWSQNRVVIDAGINSGSTGGSAGGSAAGGNSSAGGIITARSAGCAGEFAVAIINTLLGNGEGLKVAQAVLL